MASAAITAASGSLSGGGGGDPHRPRGSDLLDPLTLHILQRRATHAGKRPVRSSTSNDGAGSADDRKRSSASFLSRIVGIRGSDGSDDETSSLDPDRTEGTDALEYRGSAAGGGAAAAAGPGCTAVPKYIRVRSRRKTAKSFDHLFLAQELLSPEPRQKGKNAIWTMVFSGDGRYLAAGGQDTVVRVWAVLTSSSDSNHECKSSRLQAPAFHSAPLHLYRGHTSDVLALSWSKNNFLLSSSMDRTVRLWHVSRAECLCCFVHQDFVTSIAFHPLDDRYFLSGSLDCKLRLWNIPEKRVAFWNELPEMITAVAFTMDGRFAIAGSFVGLCLFYDTDSLRYHTQMLVRSSRGKNSKGSKITGIQTISIPPNSIKGDQKILITSNDSRVRMYNFRDKSLDVKFKGNSNSSGQIYGSFSDDAHYVICGSEDASIYIWSVEHESESNYARSYERFEAHKDVVTCAIFAPTKTRQLLDAAADPIYRTCNYGNSSGNSPGNGRDSLRSVNGVSREDNHLNGHIIVSSDNTGMIKIFRQDCAYSQRLELTSNDSGSVRGKKGTKSIKSPIGIFAAGSISQTHTQRRIGHNWPIDAIATAPLTSKSVSFRDQQEKVKKNQDQGLSIKSGMDTPRSTVSL